MAAEFTASGRLFQVWSYSVSHSELLLRSTKSSHDTTRVDVLYKGVKEMSLRVSSPKLQIAKASHEEIERLQTLLHRPLGSSDAAVFIIKEGDFLGYVVALTCFLHEDSRGYNDPSFFSIS
jgi:hypothetical protein